MSVLDVIIKRRSIRNYNEKEIPDKLLDQLKDALIWAPSSGNLQARKFFFVSKEETKEKLAQGALGQDFIAQCPLVIICCTDLNKITSYGERGETLYCICDVSASIQNMMLVAAENGLGSCWIGAFNEAKISQILDLNGKIRPIALVTVGYPDESPEPPPRVGKDEAIVDK